MKTTKTISIDVELAQWSDEKHINLSQLCNEALKQKKIQVETEENRHHEA